MMNIKSIIKKGFNSFGYLIEAKTGAYNNFKWLVDENIQTIIDVGANSGQFVNYFGPHLPGVKFHSFEPIKSVFEQLNKNVSEYNVVTYNLGLGSSNEEMEINVNTFSPSSSILELTELHKSNFKQAKEIVAKERIQIKKMDDVFENISLKDNVLLKIDVQGFEEEVIKGGLNVIDRSHIIVIEVCYTPLYKGEKDFNYIYKLMTGLGFSYKGILLEQYKSVTDGKPLYSDAIFMK